MQISTLYLQCIICIRELYRIHNELQLSRLSTGSQEAEAGNIKKASGQFCSRLTHIL